MTIGGTTLATSLSTATDVVMPGTVQVWSDIACPWASLALWRLRAIRTRIGFDDVVRIEHRAFPLELINGRPTPKPILDTEVPVIGELEPDMGWSPWQRPEWEWPGTVLLALEAVQVAKAEGAGGLRASEELDAALRAALYAEGRPISLWTEVVAIAENCPTVNVDAFTDGMSSGAGRRAVLTDWSAAAGRGVQGSPHFFFADGGEGVHNPGVQIEWEERDGTRVPTVSAQNPKAYEDLLRRAAGQG